MKALPHLTVDTTSSVAPSTTLHVQIFAFDLARAVRYGVDSVGIERFLDRMVESILHLYGEPVESFRRVRRLQQTKSLTLPGSDTYVTTINRKDNPWSSDPMLYLLLHQVK